MSSTGHQEHLPRRRFGQNFLHDLSVINDIVACINPALNDNMVEIGPGLGALTLPLLERLNHLNAIELDRDLIARLDKLTMSSKLTSEKLTLFSADALRFDYACLVETKAGSRLRIVGNLPYNVSSPLLFHLLTYRHLIADMHFMLQKEVVHRLVASPGNKAFGRLSVMFQYYCQTEHLLSVPPAAFSPQPKVDSAVIRLTPRPRESTTEVSLKSLERVVKQAFSARRKTLRNNLRELISAERLEAAGFNPSARAETLNVDDFVRLTILIGA